MTELESTGFETSHLRAFYGLDKKPKPRTYDIDLNGPSITCKLCGFTSWNVNDVANHYCGHCHIFHDDL